MTHPARLRRPRGNKYHDQFLQRQLIVARLWQSLFRQGYHSSIVRREQEMAGPGPEMPADEAAERLELRRRLGNGHALPRPIIRRSAESATSVDSYAWYPRKDD
ncbi:hypothetical protein [Paracoccus salipaludis]|uniref:hypothetical protein n=1 Tax=Paracoccus salipaludis TaxID=2032623 RepID=UPI001072BD02|nr:hypothetical protein [Paracoccus salipaludis]